MHDTTKRKYTKASKITQVRRSKYHIENAPPVQEYRLGLPPGVSQNFKTPQDGVLSDNFVKKRCKKVWAKQFIDTLAKLEHKIDLSLMLTEPKP